MPSLDSCINSIFEPGNPGLATDSGAITVPHYPIGAAIVEAASAAASPDASLFAIYFVSVTEAAVAAETQDGTVAGPTRSAMIPGAFVNSSASREANVAGTMVNL
jgi:hypothetical protein